MKTKDTVVSDKRERIIEAAVKVFSSKGFHEAKVEEIALLADVGKGTVYEYFSSKANLFQEMFKAGMEFYMNNISEQFSSGKTSKDKLRKVAELHLKFILEYRELAKITMSEHAHFDDEFRQWLFKNREEKLRAVEGLFRAGISNGEFRNDLSPKAVALVFTGMMGALFGPAVMGDHQPDDLIDTLSEMLDVLMKGLEADSTRS